MRRFPAGPGRYLDHLARGTANGVLGVELLAGRTLGPTMAKPILLSVDDDSDVLRAIERDLRSKYGAEYRVIGSDSSPRGRLRF